MNETTRKLLEKATRSIAAAENSLAGGHIEASASRGRLEPVVSVR